MSVVCDSVCSVFFFAVRLGINSMEVTKKMVKKQAEKLMQLLRERAFSQTQLPDLGM